jgi:plastocyanin
MTARLLSLLGVVALLLAECLLWNGTALGQDKKTDHKVQLVDFKFVPAKLTVREGDTIRFIQDDPHYVQWVDLRPKDGKGKKIHDYKSNHLKVDKEKGELEVKIDKGFINEAKKIGKTANGKITLYARCPPHLLLGDLEKTLAALENGEKIEKDEMPMMFTLILDAGEARR